MNGWQRISNGCNGWPKERSQRMVGNGLVTDVTDDCEVRIAYFCKK
ncbi:MAG: hypothetical protein F6J93_33660 [Oscillatoria sp. SIO1A7]|nr:hypothetical protein [Oscillatoria sp. SIO1A7]